MNAWLLTITIALAASDSPPMPTSGMPAESIYTQGEWDQMETEWWKQKLGELEKREKALDELEDTINELLAQEAYLEWLEWVKGLLKKLQEK
jgi:hypothetical protein